MKAEDIISVNVVIIIKWLLVPYKSAFWTLLQASRAVDFVQLWPRSKYLVSCCQTVAIQNLASFQSVRHGALLQTTIKRPKSQVLTQLHLV